MKEQVTITARDFYKKFNRPSVNDFPELGRRKAERRLGFKLWRQIIITFFEIYFYELFFMKKDQYFFLGGRMKLCLIRPKLKSNKGKTKFISKPNVGLFWFNMPNMRMMKAVKIKKLIGSTNRFPKLQDLWCETNDPYNLTPAYKLKEYHIKTETYFR